MRVGWLKERVQWAYKNTKNDKFEKVGGIHYHSRICRADCHTQPFQRSRCAPVIWMGGSVWIWGVVRCADVQSFNSEATQGLVKEFLNNADTRCVASPLVATQPPRSLALRRVGAAVAIQRPLLRRGGVLTLRYPLQHGVATDWEQVEVLWRHAFQVCPPLDH